MTDIMQPDPADPHSNPLRNVILPDAKKQPDRSLAIVLAAVIDSQLTDSLIGRLVDSPKVSKKMFNGQGPLTNFSAKIDFGLLIGLYGEPLAKLIHGIRGVRNVFAHDMVPLDFSSRAVAKKMTPLEVVNEITKPRKPRAGRDLYIGACEFVLGALYVSRYSLKRIEYPPPGSERKF